MFRKTFLTLTATMVSLLVSGNWLQASVIDFEGFTPGTVNGQSGWTVEDSFGNSTTAFDQEVVDDGSGNMVWRLSNAVTTGGFSDQPFSQTAAQVAGETGSALWNDYGTVHSSPNSPPLAGGAATTSQFRAGFDFRSATGAAQSDLSLSVSPAAKQSAWRNGYVAIVDDGANGFDIFFYETGTSADPFSSGTSSIEIASDLSYSDWHSIDIAIDFVDGLNGDTTGNDIVQVFVDGVLATTGSTWESYYYGSNPAGLDPGDQPQRQAVDSLVFASRGTAQPSNTGNGFFFDNVYVDEQSAGASAVPEPGSMTLLGLGSLGMGLAGRRRRKRAAASSAT